MLLTELHENSAPVFAWLEPSRGPEDLMGVRLAYIQPLVAHFDKVIKFAQEEGKEDRAARLMRDKEAYVKRGQSFFTPDFGWWMDEDDFHNGREGFMGVHKGAILHKFPNLRVLSSKQEAIDAAKQAGLI